MSVLKVSLLSKSFNDDVAFTPTAIKSIYVVINIFIYQVYQVYQADVILIYFDVKYTLNLTRSILKLQQISLITKFIDSYNSSNSR